MADRRNLGETTHDSMQFPEIAEPDTPSEGQLVYVDADDGMLKAKAADGTVVSLTEESEAGNVTTGSVDTQLTSATLNGELNDMQGQDLVDVWFMWRPQGWPVWVDTDRQTLTATGSFSATIEDIKHAENWEVIVLAEYDSTTFAHGTVESFATDGRFSSGDADYWLDPNGSDANDGSFNSEWASFQHALEELEAMTDPSGTTIGIKPGTYNESNGSTVSVTIDGDPNDLIRIIAFDNPVINLSDISPSSPDTGAWGDAIRLSSSTGVMFIGVEMEESVGFGIRPAFDTEAIRFNDCEIHHCGNTAFYAETDSNSAAQAVVYRRCEGWGNEFTQDDSTNADGFAAAPHDPNTLEYYHCVGHHNADDGFDVHFANEDYFYRCVGYRNGFAPEGETAYDNTDGMGIKFGDNNSYDGGVVLEECMFYDNERYQILLNEMGEFTEIHNCTLSNEGENPENNPLIGYWGAVTHEIRNCLGFDTTNDYANDFSNLDDQYNNWNSETDAGHDPAVQSKNPDDDLFLHLTATSAARDDGTDIGLDFSGSAPDLGCCDYYLVTEPIEDEQ